MTLLAPKHSNEYGGEGEMSIIGFSSGSNYETFFLLFDDLNKYEAHSECSTI